jgi:hypothetical protein
MNKLFDLRFIIGLFFSVIGILLLVYHFIFSPATDKVNLQCSILFTVFGIIMILLARKAVK